MSHAIFARIAFAVVAFALTGAPALADGRLSVVANPQFISQSSGGSGGDILGQVGLGYDLGPPSKVSARARIDASYDFPTASYNTDSVFSVGLSVRATTPLYFGAGVSVDSVSIAPQGYSYPVAVPIGFSGCCALQTNTVGIGSNFFVGQRIVSSAHFALAIEASYKLFPELNGNINSGPGIGIRASFL